ncbi:MAG: hypothetical protein AAGM22_25520 [Acidobacteriota bacterium]
MSPRLLKVSAAALCLLVASAVYAQPSAEDLAGTSYEQMDINWEETRQLLFVPLAKAQLDAGSHEAQVRIHQLGQPLFFERVQFDVAGEKAGFAARATTPLGLQVLSHHREERAWLIERATAGAELTVEIRLGDFILFDGAFTKLMAQSDAFREGPVVPVGGEVKVADLRERAPLKLCVDDCYDDYSECQVDFCYWDYDEFMCNEGCDQELDACLAIADPVCPTPTCTPSVITTDTDSVLISSQFVGTACFNDVFNPFGGSVVYNLINLTYQVTTRELRRNADCSTTWVTVGVTTTTQACQQRTGIPCSFGFGFPACVI